MNTDALEQRRAALRQANAVKKKRAKVRHGLQRRELDPVTIFSDGCPDYLEKLSVFTFLTWSHRWGPTRATKLLRHRGIPSDMSLGRLNPSVRRALCVAIAQ